MKAKSTVKINESFRNRDHSVIREVFGIVTFAAAVYLFIIVISYSKNDPSMSSVGLRVDDIKNLGGIVGAYISDGLLQAIGYGVYLFVLLLLFSSFRFIFLKGSQVRLTKSLSVLAVVISVSSFISLVSSGAEQSGYKAGGWIGDFIASTLYSYLSFAGALLVIVPSIILSIMFFGNISFVPIVEKLGAFSVLVLAKSKEYYIKRLERAKKNKELEKRLKIEKLTKREEPKITSIAEKERAMEKNKKEKSVQEKFGFASKDDYTVPPLILLSSDQKKLKIDKESLLMNSKILEKKLSDYGVEGKVVQVHPGPVVTQYEYEPAPGVKVNKIVGLQDDLSMALRAVSIRIVAPIPGKSVVGIEIPNNNRETVYLKDVLNSEDYTNSDSNLTLALGKDIAGKPVCTSLEKMPHLLIAGATGSGKSVGLNTMICSILFKASPEDVRFILIDPKMLELTVYDDIPHLLLPIVTDPKKAAAALRWAVAEMERRYKVMSKKGVRNIGKYNAKLKKELTEKGRFKRALMPDPEDINEVEEETKLPYIVVIIDELADLMVVASKEVEQSIARLAQMARASGIHLILATQRPSVDVLTGVIKANFPARISFQVSARTDSRTILDAMGAERLLGHGDMLFLPPGTSKVQRVHGAYISDKEMHDLVEFLKEQSAPVYDDTIIADIETGEDSVSFQGSDEYDEKYDSALEFVSELGHASISLIQRRFKIGYNRAARIIEQMERDGAVGPSDGSKPRKVLVNKKEY
jgi:S-DNA-T family DNA segregation ATPase FtsK/SpoIIIE